jgi:5-methylcytosine-specific restriction endonuclease McrA
MICTKCSVDQPEDNFAIRNKKTGKRKNQCRLCVSAYLKTYRDTYCIPDTRKEYERKYYESHKAEYASRSKTWRGQNPERWSGYSAAWAKRNPRKAANNASSRRALLRGNGVSVVTHRDIDRLVNRFDGKCAYCQDRPFEQLDHIIPVSRGGRHSIGNLLPACQPCNISKFASLQVEWRHRVA